MGGTEPDSAARRHDEPNEWAFAGAGTAPQPQRPHRPDEAEDVEEEVAVPADDLTRGFTDSLDDDQLPPDERDET